MVRRLLVLNGLASTAVAFHHAAAYGFLALFNWTNAYRDVAVPNYDMLGTPAYYYLLGVRLLIGSYAIPAFLLVSGFYAAFAADGDGRMGWTIIGTRVKKFVGPFIIWTLVFFAMQRAIPQSLNDILRAYYYIPLVIQLYLLSPWLGPLAKKHWKLFLFVTFLIQFAAEGAGYLRLLGVEAAWVKTAVTITPIWFFPSRIFFFALGLVLGFQRKLFGGWLARWKYALLAGLGLFAVLSFVEYFWVDQAIGERWLGPSFIGIFRTLYAVTFSFVLLAFDKVKLPLEKQLSQLGLISLGIYLVNTPAIYLTSSLLYKFAPWVLGRQIVYQPILTAAGLFIPVLLIQVFKWGPLKRYSPTVFG
ncbi:MAG: acyltransferase family protein [Ardenticatenaceae bacterium]|nr:acyltransferase family protein [Anaerolineales bacterium]MCB9007063.1 acyltransferase family protein [Ardenticatenaceae bacterium]